MTANEARELTNKSKNRIEEELAAVHSIIEGVSILGCKHFNLDKCFFNPRTLKALEKEGFSVIHEERTLVPGKLKDEWVYISWF